MSSAPDARDTFVQLSALLTGFQAALLAPRLDPTDLASLYLQTARNGVGSVLDDLLDAFTSTAQSVAGTTLVGTMTAEQRQQIGSQILSGPTAQTTLTAQSIMRLWYLGSWYQPFDLGDKKADLGGGVVVTSQAYTMGLAWQVMQSHAMGDSNFQFGYWASDPPPLDVFTGNVPTS